MAVTRKSAKSTNKIITFITGSRGMPVVMAFVALAIFFVLIRMKGIEQDYKYNEVVKKIERVNQENKELKAKKASYMSIKKLRQMAKKHDLKEPSNKQIIVIP
jgi:cell division protein FtsL